MIVARHEVPGTTPPPKNRPVGYGLIGRSSSHRQCQCFRSSYWKFRHSNHRIGAHTCTNHTVPYGTALCGGVVPGTSCQATISLSLRDKSHSPFEDSPSGSDGALPYPRLARATHTTWKSSSLLTDGALARASVKNAAAGKPGRFADRRG